MRSTGKISLRAFHHAAIRHHSRVTCGAGVSTQLQFTLLTDDVATKGYVPSAATGTSAAGNDCGAARSLGWVLEKGGCIEDGFAGLGPVGGRMKAVRMEDDLGFHLAEPVHSNPPVRGPAHTRDRSYRW